jgi:hypothetical protein
MNLNSLYCGLVVSSSQWRRSRLPLSSLVLGGYDKERCDFEHSDGFVQKFEISLQKGQFRYFLIPDITIGIESKSINVSIPFIERGMVLDNVTPFIWLPKSVCDQFASILNLTLDLDNDLYIWDIANAPHWEQENMSIHFDMSQSGTATTQWTAPRTRANIKTINLVNYAINPLVQEEKVYFPIKRIPSNESQIPILGRPFFQVFCMLTHYEKMEFSITPQITDPNSLQKLVPVLNENISSSFPKNLILNRTIIGAVFFIFIFLLIMVSIRFIFKRRDKKIVMIKKGVIEFEDKPQLDGKALVKPRPEEIELDGLDICEMDAGMDGEIIAEIDGEVIAEMVSDERHELEAPKFSGRNTVTVVERG